VLEVIMKRGFCLTALTLLGVVLAMTTHDARQASERLMAKQVADNLYMLVPAPGHPPSGPVGNTAVFVMSTGVALVDTKVAGYGPDILAQVRGLTDKPVTTIINSHTHFDHTGSNTEFPDTVHFVAHENTRAQMARETCGMVTNCDAFKGENAKYLPGTSFSKRLSMFHGPDQIDLYYFGRGHTDGDTFTVFKSARAMHSGDIFGGLWLPFVDVENGNGSATEFGRSLAKAVVGIPDVDTIISGHGSEPLEWSAFEDYTDALNDLAGKAKQGLASGKTVEEVSSAFVIPEPFADFWTARSVTTMVQHIYNGN